MTSRFKVLLRSENVLQGLGSIWISQYLKFPNDIGWRKKSKTYIKIIDIDEIYIFMVNKLFIKLIYGVKFEL